MSFALKEFNQYCHWLPQVAKRIAGYPDLTGKETSIIIMLYNSNYKRRQTNAAKTKNQQTDDFGRIF